MTARFGGNFFQDFRSIHNSGVGGKETAVETVKIDYQNVVGQDDLTRFDKKKQNRNNGQNNRRRDPRHNNKPRNTTNP